MKSFSILFLSLFFLLIFIFNGYSQNMKPAVAQNFAEQAVHEGSVFAGINLYPVSTFRDITDRNNVTFIINPYFGKYLTDNLAVRGGLQLCSSSYKDDDDLTGPYRWNLYTGIEGSLDYYLLLKDRSALFISGSGGAAFTAIPIGKTVRPYGSLSLNYSYFLNDKVSLNTGFEFTSYVMRSPSPFVYLGVAKHFAGLNH